MNKTAKITLVLVGCLLLLLAAMPTFAMAEGLSVSAKEAVLMSEDGVVMFQKNATEKRPIASMTKIMTLLCVYDAVESGKISLDDQVVVSTRAASMGGSQVYLEAKGTSKVENLIKSVIICSANDSCVALAEHIGGSVENFVQTMNEKAESLKLVATHFENCTGLPHISQFSCAMDVANMLRELIKHPHYFGCAGIWMEDFVHPSGRVTGMTNTNKLVRFYEGCDGGKTGFTNEAMHCLAATAKRGDTRVVSVVVGATDSKTRFKEVSSMLDFAFANYQNKVYLDVNTPMQGLPVAGGKTSVADVCPAQKLAAFGKKGQNDCKVEVVADENLRAPIAVGQKLGVVRLLDNAGNVVAQTDLLAKTEVATKTYWDVVQDILK